MVPVSKQYITLSLKSFVCPVAQRFLKLNTYEPTVDTFGQPGPIRYKYHLTDCLKNPDSHIFFLYTI